MISLLIEVFNGKENEALNLMRELINEGLDARNFLNDILEVLYLFSRRINLGPIDKDSSVSESEALMINDYSQNIEMQDIGLFWQLTIKTINDLQTIGNENLTLEMYIIQMIYLKDLGENKEIQNNMNVTIDQRDNIIGKKIDEKNLDNKLTNKIKNQLKNTNQIKTTPINNPNDNKEKFKFEIQSFQDLINKANKEKEIELKYDLERNVKLVSFSKGKIDISFNEKLNKNFIKNLTEKLYQWTEERWIISLSKNKEAKSVYEQNLEIKNDQKEKFKESKIAKDIEQAFPDAKLVEIKEEE